MNDTAYRLSREIEFAETLINSVKGLLDPQYNREPEAVEFANNLLAKLEEQNQDRKDQLRRIESTP